MRQELPSGTVTFLFTDIEGSTELLHELGPEAYAEALAEHRRLLRQVFSACGGVEVDTQGDAFFYAFASAPQAVEAAGESQKALASGPIRVRMGLHTSTPHLAAEGYVGEDVNLGTRIAASGHGGQTLFSKDTCALVSVELTDLGEHRLKDFPEPVWIFQLGSQRFPPLKTISNTNLPRPVSSFIGREREVAEVAALFRGGARLVTLSGAGGSGKTRLAIEAASELVPEFKNGTFWVELATLRDVSLVPEAIAQTLGARDGLAEHVGEREAPASDRQPGATDRRSTRPGDSSRALPEPEAARHEQGAPARERRGRVRRPAVGFVRGRRALLSSLAVGVRRGDHRAL